MKKGAWGWEIVGKLVLLLIILLVLIAIIGFLSHNTTSMWDRIRSLLTFNS